MPNRWQSIISTIADPIHWCKCAALRGDELRSSGWIPQDLVNNKSALVQVMSWFHQPTCHYLSQCCPSFVLQCGIIGPQWFNTLRPRQNGSIFAGDTFKRIFLNENNRISIKISLKLVPKGLFNNIPALVLIMAWHRPGGKPLSEPMMVRSLMHICVTRPQWVNNSCFCNKKLLLNKKILSCLGHLK